MSFLKRIHIVSLTVVLGAGMLSAPTARADDSWKHHVTTKFFGAIKSGNWNSIKANRQTWTRNLSDLANFFGHPQADASLDPVQTQTIAHWALQRYIRGVLQPSPLQGVVETLATGKRVQIEVYLPNSRLHGSLNPVTEKRRGIVLGDKDGRTYVVTTGSGDPDMTYHGLTVVSTHQDDSPDWPQSNPGMRSTKGRILP